jgi:hypothetical protein
MQQVCFDSDVRFSKARMNVFLIALIGRWQCHTVTHYNDNHTDKGANIVRVGNFYLFNLEYYLKNAHLKTILCMVYLTIAKNTVALREPVAIKSMVFK